ncbi:neurotrophin 1 isoform X2 [Pogonomyrmex barbatus]|uniref:Neurotrophin 1 isoform X2 n=1 Tax=Pogonomyrmex barbatus TaxID=144034 RepID=A0A6I9VM36_9HYME|nr:neurotrophin 1 isoform X2 [Pogonomyrmex barbatus]
MRIGQSCWVLLAVVLLSPIHAEKNTDNVDDVDDGEKAQEKISTSLKLDEDAKNRTSKAMKMPEKREQIGEVIPIIRSMSPPQKLAMATLISTRISSNDTTSPPLEEVESLLGSGNRENASRELMLPISMDIAKIISNDSDSDEGGGEDSDEMPEALPEAQELRLMRIQERRRPVLIKPLRPPIRPSIPNRRNVYTGISRPPVMRPSKRPNESKRRPTENECTFFTKTVCLEANDYPHEAIIRSLRSNKEMVSALLTDYKAQDYGSAEEKLPSALPLENKYENRYESRYESNEIKRRSDNPFDNVEEGFTCPSTVKYARPQLARAASGVWKYIINTGEHTQTIRLEKCSNPQSSCSFISENYRSSCVQIYNYHRLLTWDQKLGLHMDIFKVPTCCSCHVHGYSEIFPPHQKDPPMKPKETFPGADFATINEQKDDFQDFNKAVGLNHITKYTPTLAYDSSHGILLQNYSPSPTPSNDLSEYVSFPPVSSNKKTVIEISPTSRPSFTLSNRTRPKKPASIPRPYDKLPQQHAPNTRAPGYKGPLTKSNRPNRLNRPPFRRESTSHEDFSETSRNSTSNNRYSQPYDQNMDATSRLQNGGFDEEYQEPQRRINYNYHPIIDFFKPEAAMLQSAEPQLATQPAPVQSDNSAWKPMIS